MSKLTVTAIDTADSSTPLTIATGNTHANAASITMMANNTIKVNGEFMLTSTGLYSNNMVRVRMTDDADIRHIKNTVTNQMFMFANGQPIFEFARNGSSGYRYTYTYADSFWEYTTGSGRIFMRGTAVDTAPILLQGDYSYGTYIRWQVSQTPGDFGTAATIWQMGRNQSGNPGSFILARYNTSGIYQDAPISVGANTGNVTIGGDYIGFAQTNKLTVGGGISDAKGDVRDLPLHAQTEYTLARIDTGRIASVTGNVTVPNAVFSAGQVITIYNNGTASRNIVNAGAVTMRLAGTNDQNTRIMQQYALATVVCVAANTFIISGAGVV